MVLIDQCKAELKLGEEKQSLREVRFKKSFIQHDLVKATGIPQSKISLIERGYVSPTRNERHAIAEALGLEPGDIEWGN